MKTKSKGESCRVLRIRDEALIEIYGDRIVISTYSGYVTIYAKIEGIEDPNRLLDECGW